MDLLMKLLFSFLLSSTLSFWFWIFHDMFRFVYCHFKKRRRNFKRCYYHDCPKYRTCKFNEKVLMDI